MWSNGGRYLRLSDIVHDHRIRKDPTSDAELTERVMILYRHPSENDGGFSVANLPISILNGRLGLRTLKGIRNYPVKFITLFLNYVSITLPCILIKVERYFKYYIFKCYTLSDYVS